MRFRLAGVQDLGLASAARWANTAPWVASTPWCTGRRWYQEMKKGPASGGTPTREPMTDQP